MSNDHNIPPFFKRRIDHHKFEKMMRQGISYVYYDSKSLQEFKWKLVQATLENYLHYKYEIELNTIPVYDVADFIKYMVDTYDGLLVQYYYNMRREGKGSINESNLVETFNKIVNKSINTIKNICETSDNETWPDWLNFDTCDVLDTLGKVNVKNVEKIKNLGKYPMFNVYIDVNFSGVFEWIDYDDFFISTVASDIIRTHNIHLIFHIDEQNNTHNRQMESSSKKLIKKTLKEETNPLKKYFTKVWDTKKSEGKIPMFNLKQIRKLGLLKRTDEIRNYYIEYIGGQEELVRNIKNYFIGKTFTTQDVEDMDIPVGNYDFVFKVVDMSFEQIDITANGDPELYASFDIIEGTVDTFNGEHYDLTDHESINDELWWQLDSEIKEMIENFIWHTVDSLGVEVDQVYLEWG